jgi:hypothetical protein
MFRPNIVARQYRKGPRDIFGKESFLAPVPLPCAVVNLNALVQASSVRADSTASHGAAQEMAAQAKILVPALSSVTIGDVITIHGVFVEVKGKQPRIDVSGRLDHYELTGTIRAEI